MDCDLKQWRNQHQSEHQHSAKIPRLVIEVEPSSAAAASSVLPLFVPEPISKVSAFPDHSTTTTTTSRFPGMGGCLFSLSQWQELELQALIFKYLIAGAPVPSELLLHLKKSLINTPAYYLSYPYQHYQHYQPAMLQSGYWGRSIVDPEPGRCRRTDGKKWRCSRDVVPGQKYCERHVHRGRNRSRKPVEIPTPTTATAGGDLKTALPLTVVAPASGNHLVQHSQRASESKPGTGNPLDLHNIKEECGEEQSDGKLLRHFFDDCPRNKEDTKGIGNNGSPNATTLSISTPGRPSDFSLKLSTGNISESESQGRNTRREQYQLNWGASGWGSHQASSMGGPLAEALRSSSTSNSSSPTSVLHELRRGTVSETSSFST